MGSFSGEKGAPHYRGMNGNSYHTIGPGEEPVGIPVKETNEGYNALRELPLDELNRPTEGQVGGRRRRRTRKTPHRRTRKTTHRQQNQRRQRQ